MGRLFTRESLIEMGGCLTAFVVGFLIFGPLIFGPWNPASRFTALIVGMGIGFWLGRFGRE